MRLRRLLAALAAVALAAAGCSAPPASIPSADVNPQIDPRQISALTDRLIAKSPLLYVSDYFSFVGEDAEGHVSLALDNNRGRDGEAYQAEHFLILHDEKQGWIDLPGNGLRKYENTKHELKAIPDSPLFAFSGSVERGLTIRGLQSPLELRMGALEPRVGRVVGERGVFAMGSAPATLKWKSRTLEGRVIWEYLVADDWNRMSRSQLGLITSSVSFQGLYLKTPDGHDVYVHKTNGVGPPTAPAVKRLGFYSDSKVTEEAEALDLTVERKEQGLGFFRWPVAWSSAWTTPSHGIGRFQVEVVDFKRVGTFVLGGFGMAIVKGTLEQDGKQVPVYGWGELILWRAS